MLDTNDKHNFADSILQAAQKPDLITTHSGGAVFPTLILPGGFKSEQLNLEKCLPNPLRKTGTVTLLTCESFIAYITKQGSLASTAVYCDANYTEGKVQFVAIMNDHDDKPEWRDFRANFSPVFSEEWKRWIGHNKRQFSQVDFAAFIEDNQKDIVSSENRPSGASMLEMALNLEAKQDVVFKSAIRLQSGTSQLEYRDKEDDDTVKKMTVFEMFNIGIPVLFAGQAYQLEARLRYRINNGAMKFWYEIVRPDVTLEAAARDEILLVKAAGFPVYFGRP